MNRCISREDYLKKDNSNVGYALYVQDNMKKDDYAKLNTGEIVKVIGIWGNELNKKAIYYDNVYGDWFDASAVENFAEDIIDLIEVGDYVNGMKIDDIGEIKRFEKPAQKCLWVNIGDGIDIIDEEIKDILTKEQYMQNCYKIDIN